jgi:flagellar basal-body rod modification protein FlgD
MIPPTLIASAASSAIGLISSLASSATSSSKASAASSNEAPLAAGTSTPATKKENDVVNQAEFMKLLIAQLSNQDPLNPLDSANFSAQLAQFSSLEQLTQINQKLGDQAEETIGRFEAVGFIGREVTGASLGIAIADGESTELEYTLDRGTTVTAKIIDENGHQVATLALGQQGAGTHTFDLSEVPDAPDLEDGVYAVVLSAPNAGGVATAIDTYVTGRVTGVDLTADAPVLLLGERRLVLADVTEIKEAPAI